MRNTLKYVAVAGLLSLSSYGQKVQLAEADKQYEKYAYVDAIKTYERVFERGYKSADMLKKLGNAYYFQADYTNAAKWYAELFAMPESKENEYYYRYAQSLKAVQDYVKADQVMEDFYKRNKQDSRAKMAEDQKNYLDIIKKNSGRYTIENAGINSSKSDYGSALYGQKIVFASARDTGSVKNSKALWNGEPYTNLYAAELQGDGSLGKVERFGGKLNTKYHESTPVFTKDGQTVYFTRNNYINGKKGKDEKQTTLLKLYKATLDSVSGTWSDIKELPFNSDQYSVAHPALSPDEKTLYFASDMPGTRGLSDIFKVSINGDDSYGAPVNLGKMVNTEARETFPFVSATGELYFASEGHPGLGGLDVFVSKADGKGGFSRAQNVGEPINSSSDDFAFLFDTATKNGFFTSNRASGEGSDDIYKFKEDKSIPEPCEQTLSGVVTDQSSGKPIAYATVILTDSEMKYIKEQKADKEGKYDFGVVDCGTTYTVRGEKEGYNAVEKTVTTATKSGVTKADIAPKNERAPLVSGNQPLKEGDNVTKQLGIEMIYFDLDKSNIRPDAAVELAKILVLLEEHPSMELDVRSHTDCRNTKSYNQALSDRRAQATIDWLVKKGISRSRLTGRGYGESQLVNNCGCEPTNNSSCSEDQHQANRRSEFIITKM